MQDDLKKGDYQLEKEVKSAYDKKQEAKEIPVYLERLELSDEQKDRLVKEVLEELDAIKEERTTEQLEAKWDALDKQYDGKVEENEARQFNLCRKITKIKVDRTTNLIMQAYFKSDPIYAVSPRPEFSKESGKDVCDKQQDFLDYKLDNLPFRTPLGMTVHSAVGKGTGILKIFHEVRRELKRREERYQGTPMPAQDPRTGQVTIVNAGLDEFLKNWPKAEQDYPSLCSDLKEGKEISIMADFYDITYNDPLCQNVDLKNFYVRTATEGYEGLKTTQLIAERINYSWWDLKRLEKKEYFYDIDELIYEDKEKNKKKPKYQNETFDVLECVYYFKLNEDDEEEAKIVCWIAEDKKKVIGSILYPFYRIDSYYVPYYIKKKKTGFYQPGLAEDLTDSNIAENEILNLTLEAAYIANTITPITPEGSDVETQFLEKRWTHGVPLNARKDEIDFLQKYMKSPDLGGLISIMQYLVQGDDDVTGVSSLMSGRESPVDPTAPASKTMALLKQSGIVIEDYIMAILPSFNELAYILLQIYYQMSKEGRQYIPNPERVVGENPFAMISRNDMIARTNIQCQAYAFDFDKLNEKTEDVSLMQLIRGEPLIAQNPEAVYYLLKNVIQNWSVKWKNIVDKILPRLDDLKKQQVMVAVQAVDMYVKQVVAESRTTGQPPQFDPRQLLAGMQQMVSEIASVPPPEVIKEREQQAKGNQ